MNTRERKPEVITANCPNCGYPTHKCTNCGSQHSSYTPTRPSPVGQDERPRLPYPFGRTGVISNPDTETREERGIRRFLRW